MSYSQPMQTIADAPDISPGYPSKGKKLGPAWRTMWAALTAAGTDFQDGKELATETAKRYKLAPVTLQHVLARAADAGLLDRDKIAVATTVHDPRTRKTYQGHRPRAHYRIKADDRG